MTEESKKIGDMLRFIFLIHALSLRGIAEKKTK